MLVILNNKCNFNKDEFDHYQNELVNITSKHQLVLCPSSIHLLRFNLTNFSLGVQNISSYGTGAYTGEIAASQLKLLNVSYVIVGHSERREYFKESKIELKRKLENALNNSITPILCIGEKLQDDTLKTITNQLEIIKKIKNKEKIVIAYEPVWSIGSGKTPTIKQIEEVVRFIKKQFPNNPIIYGGSLTENNICNLKSDLLDGYLLGGISLYPKKLQLFLNQLK